VDRSGSSIVEDEEVMFETGFGPKQHLDSDNNTEENDMVYYNKDDMTNFSKGLGVNKLQSRLSLMSMSHQSNPHSKHSVDDDSSEDNEAVVTHKRIVEDQEGEPRRMLIQKRSSKNRKSLNVSDIRDSRNKKSARSVISMSSVYTGDDDEDTSEEDNPNDRSGLLDDIRDPMKLHTRRRSKKTNKWVSNKKANMSTGRKSFRDSGSLSLVLPKFKSKMKRNKLIHKKKKAQPMIVSTGSPYEEYLPARFRDVKMDDLSSLRLSQNVNKRDFKKKGLPSVYVLSPSVHINSSLPPKSKQSKTRALNFYDRGSVKSNNKDQMRASKSSLLHPQVEEESSRLEDLNEDTNENESSDHNLEEMNHDHVMFQKDVQSSRVKPHPEDKAIGMKKDLSAGIFRMFESNKEFLDSNERIDRKSITRSCDGGSRVGSRGRTYISDKAVFSTVKFG